MKMVGLQEIRKMKKLNQLKVAMDLNITRETLSHYENGKRNPDLETLITLSKYFNKSVDYLITGKEFEEK
ncbi:MAG: helix-turn-helix transcriptional regulator [Clostridia bacterium]|nr:helix-turn-helix transcriptional regulator [Clostridia bacterium]